ncbi:MAG: VOC family protein [Chloroflexi bacterium]|nr:VOC family protein [Chloroflexota bacterium]MBC7257411.1 VOC family protein [Chloroflexota bacterium]
MAYPKTSYLEHTAIRVRDIQWYIRFFQEALGMPVRRVQGDESDPIQVWTVGGIQIVADKGFEGPEGRLVHLGICTDDLEMALEEVYKWGCTELPQGRNWFATPDGLQIELMQAQAKVR